MKLEALLGLAVLAVGHLLLGQAPTELQNNSEKYQPRFVITDAAYSAPRVQATTVAYAEDAVDETAFETPEATAVETATPSQTTGECTCEDCVCANCGGNCPKATTVAATAPVSSYGSSGSTGVYTSYGSSGSTGVYSTTPVRYVQYSNGYGSSGSSGYTTVKTYNTGASVYYDGSRYRANRAPVFDRRGWYPGKAMVRVFKNHRARVTARRANLFCPTCG